LSSKALSSVINIITDNRLITEELTYITLADVFEMPFVPGILLPNNAIIFEQSNFIFSYNILIYDSKKLLEHLNRSSLVSFSYGDKERYRQMFERNDYIFCYAEPYLIQNKDMIDSTFYGHKYEIGIVTKGFLRQEISRLKATDISNLAVRDDADVIFKNILREALYKYKASDIHFESKPIAGDIRMRVDGTMMLYRTITKDLYERLRRVIFLLANLNDDQAIYIRDAKIKTEIDGKECEFRVSTLPTNFGSNIVLRQYAGIEAKQSIRDLGFDDERVDEIYRCIYSPFGIFLISGPTGSGKTSTLYAIILNLGKSMINKVLTIEDPIELNIPFATQVQVKDFVDSKDSITFANAMIHFLRHDPDIILVGEIRDYETANEAINASNTGHLVLSTIHTNSALDIVPRLLSLGLERWKISSALLGGMSQRLYRKLCPKCKIEMSRDKYAKMLKDKANIFLDEIAFYKGINKFYTNAEHSKCDECEGKGYSGRTVLYEIFTLDDTAREYIEIGESFIKTKKYLREKYNFLSMAESSVPYVKEGVLSVEEAFRLFGSSLYNSY
jgi:type IV pilus assembly protein PilB